jgi:peroxiredoxin
VRVVAASVDSADQTARLSEELGLHDIEMASGLDADSVAASVGAYLDASREAFLQPTAFVLNPEGEVVQGLYSSAAMGRLAPYDVVKLVKSNIED